MLNKNKPVIGLEISDKYIRIVEIERRGDDISLNSSFEFEIEEGVLKHGRILDKNKLAKSLREAMRLAKPKTIKGRELHFALPSPLLYTHSFKEQLDSSSGIKKIAKERYVQVFPYKSEEGVHAYKVLSKTTSHPRQDTSILLAAALKKDLLMWQGFFEERGFSLSFFDHDSLSIFRGAFDDFIEENTLILVVKKDKTKIMLFSAHGLELDHLYEVDADEWIDSEKSAKIMEDIKKGLALIKNNPHFKNKNDSIKIQLLCTESLREKLTARLKNDFDDCELDVFENNFGVDNDMLQAIGLAKRALDQKWEERDPFLPTIGHIYEIKNKGQEEVFVLSFVYANIKKFGLLTLVFFVFLFFLYTSAINTSTESEREVRDEAEKVKEEEGSIKKEEEPVIPQKTYVVVENIDMSLNVRKGPGTNFPIIAQIEAGSEQVLLKEEGAWYMIEWPDETEAWISSDYARVLD